MEAATVLYLSLSFLLLLFCLKYLFDQSKKHPQNLPPSPPNSLPIIGHLHLLKPPLHRFFLTLSQNYGPICSLKVGSRLMVIVSSSTLAEECFTKNDIVLANRPNLIKAKHFAYDSTALVHTSYGDHWRNLRRICAIEIFSNSRLNSFTNVRKDEVRRLLLKLSRDSRQGEFAKVELKSMVFDLTFNNIMRMVAGKWYYGDEVTNEAEAKEFRELIAEQFKSGGTANPADFFPILSWFGFEYKEKKLGQRMDRMLQKLIDEHRSKENNTNSMIDRLLSLQESEPHYYTDKIIKGLIWAMIVAGTETSAMTIEWAMANLLNHPQVLKKARAEIDNQIGQENLIDEPDVSKLHYLQSIISETLRLYPSAPLLIPHTPSSDCTIGGYNVPRGAIVFFNAWAIHRDPNVWEGPTSFKPERFETEERESYKLMPFGLGRRACPGAGLAQRLVGLTLGSLIQCFDWERADGKEVEMTEGIGSSMPKAQPLEALCKARPIVDKVLQN